MLAPLPRGEGLEQERHASQSNPASPPHILTGLQKFSLVLQHISNREGISQEETWQKGLRGHARISTKRAGTTGMVEHPLGCQESSLPHLEHYYLKTSCAWP